MASNVFSMPSLLALLLSLALGWTNARPWHGATMTTGSQGDDWSPRPTQMPVNPGELFKREQVDIAVCGWIGGQSASPAACASGSSCIHDTIHGYVGCCATSGPCAAGVYTSCIDQNSGSGGEDSGLADSGVYTCLNGSYCYQNAYPGGYSQYSCGLSDQATTVETTFTGQPTDLLLQIVYTGINFSPSAAAASTTSTSTLSTSSPSSSQISSSSTSSSSSSSSSSASSSSSSSSSSKSLNSSPTTSPTPISTASRDGTTTTAASHSGSGSKAIIGGVVGGLAALTCIVGIVLFFLQWRQTRRSQQRSGNFVSLRDGKSSPDEHMQGLGPSSPDESQSSMTQRERSAPSTVAAACPNNHQEEPLAVGSEIAEFSRAYNEIARFHQSNHQDTDPETHFETPGFQMPYFPPEHQLAKMDTVPLDLTPLTTASIVGSSGAGELRRDSSRRSERERQRERDRLMGENKDDENGSVDPSTSERGVRSANVREEGWSPRHLRTSQSQSQVWNSRIGSGVQRYQLVEEAPREGLQVLESTGKRGSRPARGRNDA